MLSAASGLLACPVCGRALDVDPQPASCSAGHTFDVARQGYLNLLGSRPPVHADTPAMVAARDRVLTTGIFDGIDQALSRRLDGCQTLLDVGGGTGHHLARVLDSLPSARGVSIDISVAAARRAARAHDRMASVVADTWTTLPVRPGHIDAALCLFAPRNAAEFFRVLGPEGLLLVVTPRPDHLAALRTAHGLLSIEPDKDERLLRTLADSFEAISDQQIHTRVSADAGLVRDLIGMGPNAFHGVPEDVVGVDTDISVTLWTFLRRG